jgi:hypothetical protein
MIAGILFGFSVVVTLLGTLPLMFVTGQIRRETELLIRESSALLRHSVTDVAAVRARQAALHRQRRYRAAMWLDARLDRIVAACSRVRSH